MLTHLRARELSGISFQQVADSGGICGQRIEALPHQLHELIVIDATSRRNYLQEPRARISEPFTNQQETNLIPLREGKEEAKTDHTNHVDHTDKIEQGIDDLLQYSIKMLLSADTLIF